MNFRFQKITAVIVIIFSSVITSSLHASKADASLDQAFENYDKGENVLPPNEFKGLDELTLDKLLAKPDKATIPETLEALLQLKKTKKELDLKKLQLLFEIHNARTFKAKYPENWKYVKGIDYEQMLCDRIKSLISSVETSK